MPIKNSKIKDARPAIQADAESEKGLFKSDISKGTVRVTRGEGRQPSFAFKYAEVKELSDLLSEIEELLEKNQYDTSESTTKDDYEAGSARYVPENPRGPRPTTQSVPGDAVTEGQVPSESGVVSAATQGTGAAAGVENTIEADLASGAESQAAFAEGQSEDEPQVSQPVTTNTPSDDNPFA
jgi:hypothetical protein